MSNRNALITTMTEIDVIDSALRPIELDVSSIAAAKRIGRARAYLSAAKMELAEGLQSSVDPILDLTRGVVA